MARFLAAGMLLFPAAVPASADDGVISYYVGLRAIGAYAKVDEVKINPDLMKRSLNEGFTGGEKKRNEMLQLAILEPRLAVLDETDSGLDVDAMRVVAAAVNALRSPDRSFILVTHYNRLLHHITPDVVHIMADGRLVETGGPELAEEVERDGYKRFLEEQAVATP